MPEHPAELEAVAGPLKGSSIPLSDDEVSVGREPSNGIALLDASGRIQRVNESLTTLLGRERAELMQSDCTKLWGSLPAERPSLEA